MRWKWIVGVLAAGFLFSSGIPLGGQVLPARSRDASSDSSPPLGSGADALVLTEEVVVRYTADGTSEQNIHRVVRILTARGRQIYSSENFSYNRLYTEVELASARIVTPDGGSKPVEKEQITDGVIPEARQMDIRDDNFRWKTVVYPQLEVQDTLDTTIVYRSRGPLPNHFSEMFLFQYGNPILFKQVEIRGPRSRPLYFIVKDGRLDFRKEKAGEDVIYRWSGKNLPGIAPGLGMAALPGVATRLIVSTFPSWADLSRAGSAQDAGKLEPSPALAGKVKELTGGLRDIHSKILALFRFVSAEIRYLGASMDVGAFYEPRPAAEVFDRKYAVGREKSILLLAMLRQIGVEGVDALVNISRLTDPEIPSLYFDHAICGVLVPDDGIVYMDPTLGWSSSFGETYTGDRHALHLVPGGQELTMIPHCPASRSRGRILAESTLDAGGALHSQIRVTGSGYYDFILRTVERQKQGQDLIQLWQEMAESLHSDSRVEQLQSTSPDDLATPAAVSFLLDCPGYGLDLRRFMLFRMPLATNYFDLYSLGLPQLAAPEDLKFPLFFFSTLQVQQEERLKLPPGARVLALPDPVDIQLGAFRLSFRHRFEADSILFSSEFTCESSLVNPGEYPGFRKILQVWQKAQRSMVILEIPEKSGGQP